MPKPISALANDTIYNRHIRRLRGKKIASIRRRALIATITRWWEEYGNGQPIHGAEIGVKYGGLTSEMLFECPFIEWMYAIDPWAEYPADHPDRGIYGYAGRDQQSWNWLYKRACEIVGKHGDRGRIWRTTSSEAAHTLVARGELLDFAYIDARHDFLSVLDDCRAWWNVVRPGGLVCGDDYYAAGNPKRENTGVAQAFEQFAGEVGQPFFGQHRSVYLLKPPC